MKNYAAAEAIEYPQPKIRSFQPAKSLLMVNVLLAFIYFFAIAFLFPIGNKWMFGVLVATELFHFWQAIGFLYTIESIRFKPQRITAETPIVDVFITVAGEPVDVVEETAIAAVKMDYPNFRVFLLNDGYVAKKENWREIEALAERLGITCITRKIPGGAKAGNINNALRKTTAPFFASFDADHVPHPDFLRKMMQHFHEEKIGFVQAPQYYKNSEKNFLSGGSWEQQELFFGPIMMGKNSMNSAFLCGTNMVIRREAIEQVGGMCEDNIAEDFLTSLFMQSKGWKSVYVPEVLAEGLAPEDFLSYVKQQYRWARGSLEVVFNYNPMFMPGLTFRQRFQYLQSASYYLSGVVVAINALFPLIFFVTGQTPFTISTMVLAAVFLPYIFVTIYTLGVSTDFSYTYRAVAFSMGLVMVHLKALFSTLFGIKQGFSVTSKRAVKGNYVGMVIPHILYLFLTIAGAGWAIVKFGVTSSVMTNISWAILNAVIFSVFIVAALPEGQKERHPARAKAAAAQFEKEAVAR